MLRFTSQAFNSGFNLIFGILIMFLPSLDYFLVFFLSISSLSTSMLLMHWERSKQFFLIPSLKTGLLSILFLIICVFWLAPAKLGYNVYSLISPVIVSILLSYYTLFSSYFALLNSRIKLIISFAVRIVMGAIFVLFHANYLSIYLYMFFLSVLILFTFYWTRDFFSVNNEEDIDLIYLHSVEYPKNQLWLYLSPMLVDFNILGEVYVSRQFLSVLAFVFSFRRTIWFDRIYKANEVFELKKLNGLILPYTGSFMLVILASYFFLQIELLKITLSWFFLIIVQDLKGYTNRVIKFNWFQRSWIVLIILSLSMFTILLVNQGIATKTFHVLIMMILIDFVLLGLSSKIFRNDTYFK